MDNLENSARQLNFNLPQNVMTKLGSMSWQDRVRCVENTQEGRTVLKFFSDSLDLQAKAEIETFLREKLVPQFGEFTVYFERKAAQSVPYGNTEDQKQSPPRQSTLGREKSPFQQRAIPGVRRIIAVASGKGGVGKSTVSVNLAVALKNQGYKVGLLDADIYGPSLPLMMGLKAEPQVNAENKIIPPEAYGIKTMSFGFFASEETAVIWRGPMIMKALQQFFWDVAWGELDFLVIDLPPGTGDAQLTLVQSLPLSGAVIVTTPQNVALLDAVKGVLMFQKTNIPVLGVVENMSTFTCPECGTESHIFGVGGAEQMGEKFSIPVLGHVPLIPEIRAAGDNGVPLSTIYGNSIQVKFSEIAENVVKQAVKNHNHH